MKKNKILLALYKANWIVSLLCIMAVDSESNIPLIILSISTTWLLLFTIANIPRARG